MSQHDNTSEGREFFDSHFQEAKTKIQDFLHFKYGKRHILRGKHKFCGTCKIFFYSNEYSGLIKQPFSNEKVDLVIGTGQNSLWDLAVRHRSDGIVFVDYDHRALMAHEYIYRSLFLLSQNRAEFISMLSVVPNNYKNLSTSQLLEKLYKIKHNKKSTEERREFALDILERAKKDSRIDKNSVRFLGGYLYSALGLPFDKSVWPSNHFLKNLEEIYSHFAHRYGQKENTTNSNDDFHHFLKSEQAFHYIKDLFENDKVVYISVNLLSPQIYKTVKKKFPETKNVAVNFSNISLYQRSSSKEPYLIAVKEIMKQFPQKDDKSANHIYLTTRARPIEHRFYYSKVATPADFDFLSNVIFE